MTDLAFQPVGEHGAWSAIAWALRRDLRIALRSKGELGVQLLFYAIVVTLFPLGVGADPARLRALAAGILWVAALLASLLSLPRLFSADFADGTLEQITLSPYPLPALISGKIAAHWLTSGAPLAVLSPLLALEFGLQGPELGVLTLGLRAGGGALLALLILPLYVPILIFGAGAVEAIRAGVGAGGELSVLG